MTSIHDIMKIIERALAADPRPCCFHCLGITSQDLCEQLEKHIQEKLSDVYTVEKGTCHKKDHKARVIHPKNAAAAMSKL